MNVCQLSVVLELELESESELEGVVLTSCCLVFVTEFVDWNPIQLLINL